MKQKADLERFIEALKHDPLADPPPGLESSVVELVRELVLDDARATPSPSTLERIWQRALTDAQRASTSTRRLPLSANGHGSRQSSPRPVGKFLSRNWMTAAAAALMVIAFAAFLLPAIFGLWTSETPNSEWLSPDERNEAIFRQYISQGWHDPRVEQLNEFLATDYKQHVTGLSTVIGVDGMAQFFGALQASVPDAQFTIETVHVNRETIEAEVTFNATSNDNLLLPNGTVLVPTDRRVEFAMEVTTRVVDGDSEARIAETWIQPDGYGLWFQMNMLPEDTTDLALKDQHIATVFQLDHLLAQGTYTAADLATVIAPTFVWHETTPDGATTDRNYTDLFDEGLASYRLADSRIGVERIFARDELVAVQLLTQDDTSGTQNWFEQITLYRFEAGRIVEMWRFGHRQFESETTP